MSVSSGIEQGLVKLRQGICEELSRAPRERVPELIAAAIEIAGALRTAADLLDAGVKELQARRAARGGGPA